MTRIVLIIILVLITGCTTHPKFQRQRQAEESASDSQKELHSESAGLYDGSMSTFELLRLGRVIQDYLGTPYQGQSRYREGMDCSGFIQAVFQDYNNTQLPRTARDQAGVGVGVRTSDLRYGDLVFFRTGGRAISHVGIYVGYDEFVHSSSSQGIMISSLTEKYWKKCLAGARRIIP